MSIFLSANELVGTLTEPQEYDDWYKFKADLDLWLDYEYEVLENGITDFDKIIAGMRFELLIEMEGDNKKQAILELIDTGFMNNTGLIVCLWSLKNLQDKEIEEIFLNNPYRISDIVNEIHVDRSNYSFGDIIKKRLFNGLVSNRYFMEHGHKVFFGEYPQDDSPIKQDQLIAFKDELIHKLIYERLMTFEIGLGLSETYGIALKKYGEEPFILTTELLIYIRNIVAEWDEDTPLDWVKEFIIS